jgi:alpha-ketoglutaric semialdehyde dehydrogenase
MQAELRMLPRHGPNGDQPISCRNDSRKYEGDHAVDVRTETFIPHGKHLIAGAWIGTEATFASQPASGDAFDYSVGTVDLVNRACEAAEDAFWTYAYTSRAQRADFLDAIAEEIEARAEQITAIGSSETGLPTVRLQGERGRTTGQLRLFADHIRRGDYLDRRHDVVLPDRQPLPRPDLRMIQRPIGPVAVFGASNFPLAFSTAGGDTAAALAAGCPVVVKGHSAHPGTGEIVAEAILAAIEKTGMPKGVFSLIQGGRRDVGTGLVQHPLIKAVGFTGSLAGGRALFDLCAQRPEPIPFFGELGSVNPMFILPEANKARSAEIGRGWAGSLTMGAGQFCTNPGIAVVQTGAEGDAFVAAARKGLAATGPQVMLTDGIAAAYRDGQARFEGRNVVRAILSTESEGREARPNLYETDAASYLHDHALGEEVFGPLGLVVRVNSTDEMLDLARGFEGQLTATMHMDDGDTDFARRLLPILERKAGRVLVNGFPTGVEVADSMVHGGPYPASTNFGATSVGTLSIRRFLRPVCLQNIPQGVLPDDLA